jgi:DNA-binding response OmpR family regulator
MLRGKRILVISGDDSVVREINKMLFYYGCSIESASDGGNAIKMLESTSYDIFISEIKLDDMSAFTCFEIIREFLKTPYTPYIFLVNVGSYDGEHVMTKAAELGSKDRLGKPFNRKFLLRSLDNVLRTVQERNS